MYKTLGKKYCYFFPSSIFQFDCVGRPSFNGKFEAFYKNNNCIILYQHHV